jgi:hypothetical protein
MYGPTHITFFIPPGSAPRRVPWASLSGRRDCLLTNHSSDVRPRQERFDQYIQRTFAPFRGEDPLQLVSRTRGERRCLGPISLLAAAGWVGGTKLPHHGGRSANPSWLYDWARPLAVVDSQRMPAAGSSDALTQLERSSIPLLRTWQRGAVHFQWRSDQIITEGFLDQ